MNQVTGETQLLWFLNLRLPWVDLIGVIIVRFSLLECSVLRHLIILSLILLVSVVNGVLVVSTLIVRVHINIDGVVGPFLMTMIHWVFLYFLNTVSRRIPKYRSRQSMAGFTRVSWIIHHWGQSTFQLFYSQVIVFTRKLYRL